MVRISPQSDEHESSEGDCDVGGTSVGVGGTSVSDEHESSEGDCDRRNKLAPMTIQLCVR